MGYHWQYGPSRTGFVPTAVAHLRAPDRASCDALPERQTLQASDCWGDDAKCAALVLTSCDRLLGAT
jgi:hypothetical protein